MADYLVVLMALAGKDDDVAGAVVLYGPGDGLDAVRYDLTRRGAVLHALKDVGYDGLRLLSARVIRGDNDQIGQLGGDTAHYRTLFPVPVAAAAEKGHEPAPRHLAYGAQDVFQRVRRMGVIYEDGVVPVCRHRLHAAFDSARRIQRRGAGGKVYAQGNRASQHRQRVVGRKGAGYVQGHALGLRAARGHEADGAAGIAHVLAVNIRKTVFQ